MLEPLTAGGATALLCSTAACVKVRMFCGMTWCSRATPLNALYLICLLRILSSMFACIQGSPVDQPYKHFIRIFVTAACSCIIIQLYTCQPGPPVLDRLSIFSDLAAAKAHLHVQHKLGTKLLKVSNQQSTKCYTKYQEFVAPNRWQRRTV